MKNKFKLIIFLFMIITTFFLSELSREILFKFYTGTFIIIFSGDYIVNLFKNKKQIEINKFNLIASIVILFTIIFFEAFL